MSAGRRRGFVLVAGIALGLGPLARAHEDPPRCGSAAVGMTVALYRADGTTGLVGAASECERVAYRVTLRKREETCAFSDGVLTLTTPDGMVHRLADPVPQVGGGGTSAQTTFASRLVPYTVRVRDVVNGKIRAIARYQDGVSHDNAQDTRGLWATSDRNAPIVWCGTTDACTSDRCDPTKPGPAACSSTPLCDDGDPLTADTCTNGECAYDAIASTDRAMCPSRPSGGRGHHALAGRTGAPAPEDLHAGHAH